MSENNNTNIENLEESLSSISLNDNDNNNGNVNVNDNKLSETLLNESNENNINQENNKKDASYNEEEIGDEEDDDDDGEDEGWEQGGSEIDLKDNQPSVTTSSRTWYPGKFLGRQPPSPSSNNEEEGKSKWTWRRNSISGKQEDDLDNNDDDENSSVTNEEIKKERMIVYFTRMIREKYMERKLTGRIYVYRLSGLISTALTSDVSQEDVDKYIVDKANKLAFIDDEDEEKTKLDKQYKRALTMTDTILNSLERRSMAWMGCDFSHQTMITRGSTIGISDPFLGKLYYNYIIVFNFSSLYFIFFTFLIYIYFFCTRYDWV